MWGGKGGREGGRARRPRADVTMGFKMLVESKETRDTCGHRHGHQNLVHLTAMPGQDTTVKGRGHALWRWTGQDRRDGATSTKRCAPKAEDVWLACPAAALDEERR